MTEPTPSAAEFTEEHTSRASEDRFTTAMLEASYDEKDDMQLLRDRLARRKKPIYAGLAFLCVVVVGVSIAVSTGGSTDASTASGYVEPTETTPAPAVENAAAGVHAADVDSRSGSASGSTGGSISGEASLEDAVVYMNITEAPTPEPTTGPILPYKALDFDWKDPSNWEYSGGQSLPGDMISQDGIKLTSANSPQPIRTKQAWGGEKIVYIEWERSDSSDTNIWMLNKKIQNQFGVGNGWPYWGELDIFEMFTQDAREKSYDFGGFKEFGNVASYGQLTLHNGPAVPAPPCFCPSSASKSAWYKDSAPMTSGCTAQFANTPKNSMATIWGTDGNGQYLQLYQNPTITLGGKDNGAQTYDITPGGTVTPKIYNNKDLFWGTPSSAPCAAAGGHNPATGFPFFEDFYLIFEEQKKNDASAWFKVNNVQIFKK